MAPVASMSSAGSGRPWEDASGAASRSSDFVEALARGLDIITAFSPTATALSVSEVAARTVVAAADGPAPPDDARAARVRRGPTNGAVHAHDQGAGARHDVHRRARHLGAGPPAPARRWSRRRASPARCRSSTAATSCTWPGCRCRRSSRSRSTSEPASRRWRRRWGTCCSPISPAPSWTTVLTIAVALGDHPAGRTVRERSSTRDLAEVRERGWALSDERLSLGIRSIAAPVRDALRLRPWPP